MTVVTMPVLSCWWIGTGLGLHCVELDTRGVIKAILLRRRKYAVFLISRGL